MSMADSELATLTLASICLDVQIGVCMFLHPSDILALRKTCKALQLSTRQRVVWVAALHRVCLDNILFLPSFPISDMSDLEIEKAAMGPRRWIELCAAFQKQHLNDTSTIMCPRKTRTINDSLATEIDIEINKFFLVPGGRYLVSHSPNDHSISVWDLGHTSSARTDCKLISSVLEGRNNFYSQFGVQATPDRMGLTIFLSNATYCSVYEIYPQTETPHLTQIAHLDFGPSGSPLAYLLPETVIWFCFFEDRTVVGVWDYRLNHSISFSVDIDARCSEAGIKVMATKTAVIFICEEAILIWAIPPLSPQPPDFFDHSPAHIPPLFTIPFPDGIELHPVLIRWNTISPWYFGSSQALYFDALCEDSRLHRFQIMLKPDLSTAFLHVINTSELTPPDFDYVIFYDYMICEDILVSCWRDYDSQRCGVYMGHGGPAARVLFPDNQVGLQLGHKYHFSLCPASGRFVCLHSSNSVAVLDFF